MALASLPVGGHLSFPNNSGPPFFGTLKSYWDGRDLTPSSGTADDWIPRDGDEQSTLVNLSDLATVASYGGKLGVTGRMQISLPNYNPTAPGNDWSYFYVLKVPPSFSGFKGVSAYYGKPLQFFWDGAVLKSARGTDGVASFESTLHVMVADCSSWVNKLLSLVVVMTDSRIDFYYELDGVPGSASYVGGVVGSPTNQSYSPRGHTLGGFADSGGNIDAPFFCSAIMAGAGTSTQCQNLAAWGTSIWL